MSWWGESKMLLKDDNEKTFFPSLIEWGLNPASAGWWSKFVKLSERRRARFCLRTKYLFCHQKSYWANETFSWMNRRSGMEWSDNRTIKKAIKYYCHEMKWSGWVNEAKCKSVTRAGASLLSFVTCWTLLVKASSPNVGSLPSKFCLRS